ncbi:MAG: hypothetical protein J6T57_03595, partial [Alphaproteobacteria bacterium]|nr:hypothetical protein [Alphaproteobacteria bacterium]
EKTIVACKSAQQPAGRRSLKDSMFTTAKMIAEIGAENRYLADLDSRLAELSREQDVNAARENCLTNYRVEKKPKATDENKNYSYIRSVSFEPSLRNCHVCRMQRVCEAGGISKGKNALAYGVSGASTGLGVGATLGGGWGALIGGAGGALLGAVGGAMSGGETDSCQEIESCEDINM